MIFFYLVLYCTVSSAFYLSAGSSLSLGAILKVIAAERTLPISDSPGTHTLMTCPIIFPHVLLSPPPLCSPEHPVQNSVYGRLCMTLPSPKLSFYKSSRHICSVRGLFSRAESDTGALKVGQDFFCWATF